MMALKVAIVFLSAKNEIRPGLMAIRQRIANVMLFITQLCWTTC